MIRKSALILLRGSWPEAELLLVRESGRPHWLFPGGKRREGESSEQALAREIREELSAEVEGVSQVGEVEGYTSDSRPLSITLFTGTLAGTPVPSSEIESIRWLRRGAVHEVENDLTPITVARVFPYLAEEGIW